MRIGKIDLVEVDLTIQVWKAMIGVSVHPFWWFFRWWSDADMKYWVLTVGPVTLDLDLG